MEQQQSSFKEKERIELREPRRFKVTIYNDDFTKGTHHRLLQIIGRSGNTDAAGAQEQLRGSGHLLIRHRPLQSTESHPHGTQ